MRWACIIFVFGIVFILMSCNSKVFIDEFLSDSTSIFVTEEENEVTLRFDADNWDILDVSCIYSDIYKKVTDLDGNTGELPFENNGKGVVRCYNKFFDLRIEKRKSSELKIVFWENMYDTPLDICITVGNQYDRKDVDLNVGIMQKYRIDSVVYDWNKCDLYTSEVVLVDSLLIDNSKGSTPLTASFYPYKNSVRNIKFRSLNGVWEDFKEEYRKCLGNPLPQIVIPDVKNNKLVLGNTEITFGLEEQQIPADLDKNLKAEKTVAAGCCRKWLIYNGVDKYFIPYKMYVSHPTTGRQRVFEGELQSTSPRDYLMLPKNDVR